MIAKNGGTAGFSSDMKLNLTTKKGAVGLINSSVVDMGAITWAVFGKNERSYPPRANINLAPYAGTYTWTDATHPTPQTLQVSNIAGTYLFLNNLDLGNYYPSANYNFFKLDTNTTLLFGIDNSNNITTLTLSKGTTSTTATRTPPAPKPAATRP